MTLYHYLVRFYFSGYKFLFRPRLRRVRCGVFHNEKILLVRNVGGNNMWTLPGGGSKTGENPITTAEREMHEELSIKLRAPCIIGRHVDRERYAVTESVIVTGRVDSEVFKRNIFELRQARWFSQTNLPGGVAPVVESLLGHPDR